jgi:hypothetical protein
MFPPKDCHLGYCTPLFFVLLQLISTFARLICSLSRRIWWASSYTLYTCTILFAPDIVRSLNTNIRSTITDSFYSCKQSVQAKNFMFMYELDIAPQSSPRTVRRQQCQSSPVLSSTRHLPLSDSLSASSVKMCPHHAFLSYTKRASSLPAKLGSGIWHTFSHPGIDLANQSTSNSSAKAV